jgi:tetratricopeptide (TPR) repeat protein
MPKIMRLVAYTSLLLGIMILSYALSTFLVHFALIGNFLLAFELGAGIFLIGLGLALNYFSRNYLEIKFAYLEREKIEKAKMKENYRVKAWELYNSGNFEEAEFMYQKCDMPAEADYCRKLRRTLIEAKDLQTAGRFEEAALKYDELKMWEAAGKCRRLERTNYNVSTNVNMGKVGTISMECPYCRAASPITSKQSEVQCQYCGKTYIIPKKLIDLL